MRLEASKRFPRFPTIPKSVSLRLCLSLPKYVPGVELGFNHVRTLREFQCLKMKYALVFVVK